jgi:hypothetical protein
MSYTAAPAYIGGAAGYGGGGIAPGVSATYQAKTHNQTYPCTVLSRTAGNDGWMVQINTAGGGTKDVPDSEAFRLTPAGVAAQPASYAQPTYQQTYAQPAMTYAQPSYQPTYAQQAPVMYDAQPAMTYAQPAYQPTYAQQAPVMYAQPAVYEQPAYTAPMMTAPSQIYTQPALPTMQSMIAYPQPFEFTATPAQAPAPAPAPAPKPAAPAPPAKKPPTKKKTRSGCC